MSAQGRDAPRSVRDYLELTEGFLAGKQVDSARLDAQVLLAEAVSMARLELLTQFDRPLAADEVSRYRELVRRRALREPVSYILGRREFWSLDFVVDRRVLIPRPESELLVEQGARLLRGLQPEGAGLRAADVGTGSGALAVSLASEVPQLQVTATDISAAALEVAPNNAQRNGVADRVRFVLGDLCQPLAEEAPFDLVVSNPPYVTRVEHGGLAEEIRNWEPDTALVAGDDGMSVTRRLLEQAPEVLAAQGWMLVEVGTQAEAVREAFQGGGWRDVTVWPDLADRPRVVGGCRPA